MTKEEAIKLEERCDKIMTGYLGRSCGVSMALTGRLKIMFNDGDYITWDVVENDVDYINYTGYYGELLDDISMIEACINDNQDVFEQLMWSYNHRRGLEA